MPSEQSRRAPPVGRALRILLGLVLIANVVPAYFRVSLGVVIASLLLMLALIIVDGVILIASPRFIMPMAGYVVALALLIALYVAGSFRLPIVGGGRGQLAAAMFLGISLVVAGVRAHAGCELVAIPGAFFRKGAELPCLIFSPLDRLERHLRNKRRV
ncbi:MAG: hypothetical protein ACREIF_02440 [Chthoniobacterales bacterium]